MNKNNPFDEVPDHSDVPNWYKIGLTIFSIVVFILVLIHVHG